MRQSSMDTERQESDCTRFRCAETPAVGRRVDAGRQSGRASEIRSTEQTEPVRPASTHQMEGGHRGYKVRRQNRVNTPDRGGG